MQILGLNRILRIYIDVLCMCKEIPAQGMMKRYQSTVIIVSSKEMIIVLDKKIMVQFNINDIKIFLSTQKEEKFLI